MGHKGVRTLFGGDYVAAMNRLFLAVGGWNGAESSIKCNTGSLNRGIVLIELFQHRLVDHDGRVEAVNGARAGVEQVGNRIELLLAVHREVGALGQVLTDQPVGRAHQQHLYCALP